MSTGDTFRMKKPPRHDYRGLLGYCRKIGAALLYINNGAASSFPATDTNASNAVSQIPAAAGTTVLLEPPANSEVAIALHQLRLFGGGTGFSTVYAFTVASITIDPGIGSTWTNNAHTFTITGVALTGSAGSRTGTLYATATGAPGASGTLTKATGTGDSTVAFSAETTSGVSLLTLQYSDGTLIGTVDLQTALASTNQVIELNANTSGVTLSAANGINPRNAPLGKGISAVLTNVAGGSAIDVLLVASQVY